MTCLAREDRILVHSYLTCFVFLWLLFSALSRLHIYELVFEVYLSALLYNTLRKLPRPSLRLQISLLLGAV